MLQPETIVQHHAASNKTEPATKPNQEASQQFSVTNCVINKLKPVTKGCTLNQTRVTGGTPCDSSIELAWHASPSELHQNVLKTRLLQPQLYPTPAHLR
jgi:hypothetical protein